MKTKIVNENHVFKSNLGEYRIDRFPARNNELLQGWNAADEYLIDYLSDNGHLSLDEKILICNDSFGALAVALHQFQVYSWSDSWISHQATLLNYQSNDIDDSNLQLIDRLHLPDLAFTTVIIKVPKVLALLEFQLIKIAPLINDTCQVVVIGMIKNMPPNVWKLLEKYLGETQTSLAKKKSRLIFVKRDSSIHLTKNPYPTVFKLENTKFEISNHANLFSRQSLDIGTRFFLEHLPNMTKAKNIVDLGCGNGVLGLMAANKIQEATIHFFDESYMAIDSTKTNFSAAFNDRDATYHVGDGLSDFAENNIDLILCKNTTLLKMVA